MFRNKSYLILILIFFSFVKTFSNVINFTQKEKKFIKDHPVIEFGYEPNWPPYELYRDGEYQGIIGDYVKVLESQTGIDFQPIPNITWDETINGLKSGAIKTSICVAITKDRARYLNFTDPYISSFMVIITKKDYGFVGGIEYLMPIK